MQKHNFLILIISIIAISGCSVNTINTDSKPESSVYPVYSNLPEIIDNDNNRITPEKAALGKKLFFETRLSKNGTIACASCHQPHFAFASKNQPLSYAEGGLTDARNVPPIFNIGFYTTYNWDGHSSSLEEMIHADFSVKTVFNNDDDTVIARISSIPVYRDLYNAAFDSENITIDGLTRALSVYVRTIVSGDSPYDRFVRGDKSALGESEKRGMDLFLSDKAQCSVCHTPPLFTDMKFHNTGVTTHYFDFGRFYVTGNNFDRGKFRTPTLRNVAFTPPYMHNGELAALEDVIEHYNRGGRPFIHKSELIKKRNFTIQEKKDLVAFLLSLTDSTLINDERYSRDK